MRRFLGRLEKENVVVEGDELNHLSSVIRLREGDKFICITGDQFEYVCQLQKVDKRQAIAKVLSKSIAKANPQKNIVLFQALPKKEAFETIVQKACELGASKLVPFVSEHTVNKSGINLDRYKAIIASACKQCERSIAMDIENQISFGDLLDRLKKYQVVLFANEIDGKNWDLCELFDKNAKDIALVVGCEGGFTDKEKDELTLLQNVKSLSLGRRILRSDTASILLLGLCSLIADN